MSHPIKNLNSLNAMHKFLFTETPQGTIRPKICFTGRKFVIQEREFCLNDIIKQFQLLSKNAQKNSVNCLQVKEIKDRISFLDQQGQEALLKEKNILYKILTYIARWKNLFFDRYKILKNIENSFSEIPLPARVSDSSQNMDMDDDFLSFESSSFTFPEDRSLLLLYWEEMDLQKPALPSITIYDEQRLESYENASVNEILNDLIHRAQEVYQQLNRSLVYCELSIQIEFFLKWHHLKEESQNLNETVERLHKTTQEEFLSFIEEQVSLVEFENYAEKQETYGQLILKIEDLFRLNLELDNKEEHIHLLDDYLSNKPDPLPKEGFSELLFSPLNNDPIQALYFYFRSNDSDFERFFSEVFVWPSAELQSLFLKIAQVKALNVQKAQEDTL